MAMTSSIVSGQTGRIASTLTVPGLRLPVGLRIVGRGPHMGHARLPNEDLEVLGHELRAVVGDDPRSGFREALEPTLDDGLDVDLLHGRSDLPVNDEARV